ncbi:MAG: hypothetical protein ACK4UN_03805 [Limisphaerales bacterium]
MTRKEFETFRLSVEKEKFTKLASDPIEYGIQRIEFRRQKLKTLINAGKSIDSRTIQAKVARWKRQLDRLEKSEARLSGLKDDISAAKLQIPRTDIQPAAIAAARSTKMPSRVSVSS